MEASIINSTSWDNSHNFSNISFNNDDFINGTDDDDTVYFGCYTGEARFIKHLVTWTISCVGLPLTLVAIFAVYSLVRSDHVAPIYIINLLVSDLIQLCFMVFWLANECKIDRSFFNVYYFGLMASIGFMVCVALERYLVIAWPLWYRFRRTIRVSIGVCVVVWALPLVYVLPLCLSVDFQVTENIFAVFLLIPLPLLIFFLGGTVNALSAAHRVPSDEKRRIVAILVVVLLIYTLLFLPSVAWSLSEEARNNDAFSDLSYLLLQMSPLADLTMYVFVRKGAIDKLLVSVCCCRMDSNHHMKSVNDDSIHTLSTPV